MEIHLNAEVDCLDGRSGRCAAIVVTPRSARLTHLVIRENDTSHTYRLVPVDQVAETAPDAIQLRCTREVLAKMEPFVDTEFVETDVPFMPIHSEPPWARLRHFVRSS